MLPYSVQPQDPSNSSDPQDRKALQEEHAATTGAVGSHQISSPVSGLTQQATTSELLVIPSTSYSYTTGVPQDAPCNTRTPSGLPEVIKSYQTLLEALKTTNNNGQDVAETMQKITRCRFTMERLLQHCDWHTLCMCVSKNDLQLLMGLFPCEQEKKVLFEKNHGSAVSSFMQGTPKVSLTKHQQKILCQQVVSSIDAAEIQSTEHLLQHLLQHGASNVLPLCQDLAKKKSGFLGEAAKSLVTEFLTTPNHPPDVLCSTYIRHLTVTQKKLSPLLEGIVPERAITSGQTSALCTVLEACETLTLSVESLSHLTISDRKNYYSTTARLWTTLNAVNHCPITAESLPHYLTLLTTARHSNNPRVREALRPLYQKCLSYSELCARNHLGAFLLAADQANEESMLVCLLDTMTALLQCVKFSNPQLSLSDMEHQVECLFKDILKITAHNETSQTQQKILHAIETGICRQFFTTCAKTFQSVPATPLQEHHIAITKKCLAILMSYCGSSQSSTWLKNTERVLTKTPSTDTSPALPSTCAECVDHFLGAKIINNENYVVRTGHISCTVLTALCEQWNQRVGSDSSLPTVPDMYQKNATLTTSIALWLSTYNVKQVSLSHLGEDGRNLFSERIDCIYVDGTFLSDAARAKYAVNNKDGIRDSNLSGPYVTYAAKNLLLTIIQELFALGITEEEVLSRLLNITRVCHQGLGSIAHLAPKYLTIGTTLIEIGEMGMSRDSQIGYNICITSRGDTCRAHYGQQQLLASYEYNEPDMKDPFCLQVRRRKYWYTIERWMKKGYMDNGTKLDASIEIDIGKNGHIECLQGVDFSLVLFGQNTDDNSEVHTEDNIEKHRLEKYMLL